jgi:hypothetical protein
MRFFQCISKLLLSSLVNPMTLNQKHYASGVPLMPFRFVLVIFDGRRPKTYVAVAMLQSPSVSVSNPPSARGSIEAAEGFKCSVVASPFVSFAMPISPSSSAVEELLAASPAYRDIDMELRTLELGTRSLEGSFRAASREFIAQQQSAPQGRAESDLVEMMRARHRMIQLILSREAIAIAHYRPPCVDSPPQPPRLRMRADDRGLAEPGGSPPSQPKHRAPLQPHRREDRFVGLAKSALRAGSAAY